MPVSPEQDWEYWDEKATALWREQMTSVSTAAAKWSAMVGTLLGVFGAVAFAGGLATIERLDDPWNAIAKIITTAAVLASVVGIVLLAAAAGGLTTQQLDQPLTGAQVKTHQTVGIRRSLELLRVGRWFSAGAALLVIIGSLIILWVGPAPVSRKPPLLIAAFPDGAVCGPAVLAQSGKVTVAGRELDSQMKAMVVVTACSADNEKST
jgi:hypothetical protein